jgi:signal peptidase
VSTRRKIIKAAGNVLFILFLALLCALVYVIFAARRDGDAAQVFGLSMYTVQTGSMSPTIPVGSLVLVKEVPAEDIQVGDVITFFMGSSNVTHRVVAINYSPEDDYRSFATRGDANNTNDPRPIPYEDVYGVVQWNLPGVGRAVDWLKPPNLGLLVIVIPCGLIIVVEVAKLVRFTKKSKVNPDNKQNTDNRQDSEEKRDPDNQQDSENSQTPLP